MLDSILTATEGIDPRELVICIFASLGLGLLVARIHMIRNTYSKNFVITLAILPILVQSPFNQNEP